MNATSKSGPGVSSWPRAASNARSFSTTTSVRGSCRSPAPNGWPIRTGLLPGEKAVFAVGDDLGIEAAAELSDLGLEVLCVADCRPDGQDPGAVETLLKRDIPFVPGWTAGKVRGCRTVEGVILASVDGVRQKEFPCDLLVASAGLAPAAGPLFLAQAKMAYDVHTGFFLPRRLPPRVHAAGRILG